MEQACKAKRWAKNEEYRVDLKASNGEYSLTQNPVMTDDTSALQIHFVAWKLKHIEQGVKCTDYNTVESYYIDPVHADTWLEKHKECAQYRWNNGSYNFTTCWTDAWRIQLCKESNKVTFQYTYTNDVNPFIDLVNALKRDPPGCYATWFYRNSQGAITSTVLPINGNLPHSTFYPDIPNLTEFYDEFVKSSANVLLLIGPPGTGKTTFLRGLLRHSNFSSWVTYDPSIQQDESFAVTFAEPSGSGEDAPRATVSVSDEAGVKAAEFKGRVLILEDCDALLEARTEGNSLMNRILNLSDGIIELPKRKLIFSTNLPSMSSIDEALLRPGRCFGVVRFRLLKPIEAAHAAASVGLKRTFNAPVTLAEAINSDNGTAQVVRKIGFL